MATAKKTKKATATKKPIKRKPAKKTKPVTAVPISNPDRPNLSLPGAGDAQAADQIGKIDSAKNNQAPDPGPGDLKDVVVIPEADPSFKFIIDRFNRPLKENAPKFALDDSEIEDLARTAPPIIEKYLPGKNLSGPEAAFGSVIGSIFLKRIKKLDFSALSRKLRRGVVPISDPRSGQENDNSEDLTR